MDLLEHYLAEVVVVTTGLFGLALVILEVIT